MDIQTNTTLTKQQTIKINRDDILRFLKERGLIEDEEDVKKIYIQVPGGGDYSNCKLDIGDGYDDIPIIIELEDICETQ